MAVSPPLIIKCFGDLSIGRHVRPLWLLYLMMVSRLVSRWYSFSFLIAAMELNNNDNAMDSDTPAAGPVQSGKKQRTLLVDEARVLDAAHEILNRSGSGSLTTADRRFRELFGCSVTVVVILWTLIDPETTMEGTPCLHHLLFALIFLKVYCKESTLSTMAGVVDEKTFRNWAFLFVDCGGSG